MKEHFIFVFRGDEIHIPVAALHMNPEYFSEPDKFIPERFSMANKEQLKP